MFKKKKWIFPLMFILVVSLVLTGCTNDPAEDEIEDAQDAADDAQDEIEDAGDDAQDAVEDAQDEVDDTAQDAEEEVRDMNYEDITLTAEDVFDKFMELHPDAKIKEIDLDKELMEYQYVVEGYDNENDYEVKINPVNGEVISDDSETVGLDDEDEEIKKEHLANVDSIIEKAKAEDGSDSELDEWNISVEDGKVVMDVEIGLTEYSYDMETETLLEKDM